MYPESAVAVGVTEEPPLHTDLGVTIGATRVKPSSIVPLQLLSIPSKISVAPGFTVAFVLLQSVLFNEYPTGAVAAFTEQTLTKLPAPYPSLSVSA